jgi:Aromatic-ring-opening dioxygenase LigAB, LigA subunit
MSIYAVHKIAHLVQKDPAFRERLRQAPSDAIADFPLTPDERSAILAGDVGRLAQLGAHGYVIGAFAQQQVLGLTMANYPQRIHDPGSTV